MFSAIVRRLLDDRESLAAVRRQCAARLNGHRYRDRLSHVLALTLAPAAAPPVRVATSPVTVATPKASVTPRPFGRAPRRNLIYHVWPVRGSTWRWNLDELKRRIDLFNGGA